jgi:copper transport protein
MTTTTRRRSDRPWWEGVGADIRGAGRADEAPVRSLAAPLPARAALLLLLGLLAFPLPAAGHQRLLRTEPERDAAVETAPVELRLEFAEPVQLAFTRITLHGPDGRPVALAGLRLGEGSPEVLVALLAGPLAPGTYQVIWATASQDGHPVRGEYPFTVLGDPEAPGTAGEPAGAVPAPGQDELPPEHHPPYVARTDFGAESPGYVLVRWLTFVGLLGVIGTVGFVALVLRPWRPGGRAALEELVPAARSRASAVGLAFAGLLGVAVVARLYAQSLAMHGPDHALDLDRVGSMIRRTVWGWGWTIQALATFAAGLGFLGARRGARSGWVVASIAALLLTFTPALSGHAVAMTGAGLVALAVGTDALHVLAAAGWLGSLLVLLLAGIPAAHRLGPGRRGGAVAALVRSFSPVALSFAGLLLLTGSLATILHSASLEALLSSRYGALLLLKIGVFLLVLAAGAYNFRKVQPGLGSDAGTARLRRTAWLELGAAALVLLVTAMLVATARPYQEVRAATPPAAMGEGHQHQE